jgi:hypothetical protein
VAARIPPAAPVGKLIADYRVLVNHSSQSKISHNRYRAFAVSFPAADELNRAFRLPQRRHAHHTGLSRPTLAERVSRP